VSFEPELPLRRVDAMKRAHVWMVRCRFQASGRAPALACVRAPLAASMLLLLLLLLTAPLPPLPLQAGVTKVALRFEERFWPLGQMSNTGLRGGPNRPAFQLYDSGDASDKGGAALTFFTVAEVLIKGSLLYILA